jgi:phosphomannomutase
MSTRQSGRAKKPTAVAAAAAAAPKRASPAAKKGKAGASKKKKPAIAPEDRKILALFDVDGTLTVARKSITPEMHDFMMELKESVVVGVVGGSDLVKQKEQVGEDVVNEFDYSFSENGLIAYKNGELIHTKSMTEHLGEAKLKEFLNFVLNYLSTIDCPVKRGTFIEYRTGMLNISPIGRQCSQQERDDFEKFDNEAKVREKMVTALEEKFGDSFGLKFSIGGQISFDVFPKGWDKTYCLQFVENDYKEIHFFGDKTFKGGNDYEIFSDPRVKGHTVNGWEDTMQQCKALFFKEESDEKTMEVEAPANGEKSSEDADDGEKKDE